MDNKKKLATRILFAAGMTLAYHMTALAQDAPAQPASAQAPAAPAVQSLSQMHFAAGGLNLTPTDAQGHAVHIYPTPKAARALLAVPTPTGALNYNGGPIMPWIGIYSIFWLGKLQSGGTATLTSHYETVADDFAADYAGHSISSNNTQYYQVSPSAYVTGLSTIGSAGSYGGSYVDTDSFPASGCAEFGNSGKLHHRRATSGRTEKGHGQEEMDRRIQQDLPGLHGAGRRVVLQLLVVVVRLHGLLRLPRLDQRKDAGHLRQHALRRPELLL